MDDIYTPETESVDGLRASPEHKLVVAILGQAVEDAVVHPPKNASRQRLMDFQSAKADAIAWIESNDSGLGSAKWCADLIGLDIDIIRSKIRAEPESARRDLQNRKKKRAA